MGDDRWQQTVGAADEFLTLVDADHRICFINHVQPGLAEVVGTSVYDFVDPRFHDVARAALVAAVETGLPQHFESDAAGPDGGTSSYSSWVTAVPPGQGEAVAAIVGVDVTHLRRMEAALAGTQAMLASVVEHAPDVIIVVDRQHEITFINRDPMGFGKEAIVGADAESFVAPADREMVRAAIDSVFATGEPTAYQTVVPSPEGERWFSTRLGPVRRGSVVERVSMVSTDITEQKRAEQSANRERQSLAALERVNRIIVGADDIEAMLDRVVAELLDTFECDRAFLLHPCNPDAATYKIPFEHVRPGWPGTGGAEMPMEPEARAAMAGVLAQPRVLRADPQSNPLPADNPMRVHFGVQSLMVIALHPHVGDPWMLGIHHCEAPRVYEQDAALFEAIASRVADGLSTLLVQRELQQSEERFRALVEGAPEGIGIMDRETGEILDANDQLLGLLGVTLDELRSVGIAGVSAPVQPGGRSVEEALTQLFASLEGGEPPPFEWTHLGPDGEPVPCEIRLSFLPHPERVLVRGSITDISDRKAAEAENARLAAELFQAQKMEALGQLTGGVAHDFNNLLTVILGNLELLELFGDDPAEAREHAEQAIEAARRAAAVTQRLLAFSRKQRLAPVVVRLDELVEGIAGMVQRALGETVAVGIAAGDELWACKVDRTGLENAILNLAINARDAMGTSGRLAIETANVVVDEATARGLDGIAAGEYVRLVVRDDGAGMPADVVARAFEPFFTTKDVSRGSGLGLSMVYGFVRQSGGVTQIESRPGEGTTVTILLPRVEAAESVQDGRRGEQEAPSGGGELILVVEDEPAVLAMTVRMLRGLGYETLHAGDGAEAMAVLAEANGVGLLLSDVVLPGGVTGVDLALRAREQRPELPVLLMSGYSPDKVGGQGLEEHEARLLAKPFTLETLAARVRDALGRG